MEIVEKLKKAHVPLADKQLSRNKINSIHIVVEGDHYGDFFMVCTVTKYEAVQELLWLFKLWSHSK